MTTKTGKIRVGIIRCDTHGMYYGALMEQHDPLILRGPLMDVDRTKYSWPNGTVHFYFYTWHKDPAKMTIPAVDGFQIVKVWDQDQDIARAFSRVFYGKPMVCRTFEEVSDNVDLVLIADCNGDGRDHLRLVTPSLEKNVPTFVDKPFAYDVRDAQEMIRMAIQHGTPLMSLSILREVPHFTRFKNRFSEIDEPEFGIIKGGGASMSGQIHAISLAQHLFGSGVDSVECMGKNPLAYIHLNYGGKPGKPCAGVVLNCDAGGTPHCAFYASVYGKIAALHSPAVGDFEYPYGAIKILEKIKKMIATGKPQAPYEEMMENIAVADAARIAQATGKTVCLKDAMEYAT